MFVASTNRPRARRMPNVFRDHLIERQSLGVGETLVNFGRHFDEADLAWPKFLGPMQRFGQPQAVLRRIPLHDDHFGWNMVPPRLLDPAVDESLHAAEQIARRDRHFARSPPMRYTAGRY